MSDGRILEFDAARAVAVVVVMVSHALTFVYPLGYQGGVLATLLRPGIFIALGTLFFVSGFVLSRSCPSVASPSDVWRFARRRLLRIYPLYLLALMVFVAFLIRPLTWPVILAHVAAVQMWFVPWVNPTAQTLWFVSVLVLMYLAFVLFSYRVSTSPRILARMAAILAVFAAVHVGLGIGDLRIVLYYPAFAFGALSGRDARVFELVRKPVVLALTSVVALGACALLDVVLRDDGAAALTVSVVLTLAVQPLVWWLANRLLSFRTDHLFISRASYASFGAYLFHRPVLSLVASLLPAGAPLWVRHGALTVAAVAGAGLVGFLVQTVYDGLRRRLSPRSDVVVGLERASA